jgi:hypothetical protein
MNQRNWKEDNFKNLKETGSFGCSRDWMDFRELQEIQLVLRTIQGNRTSIFTATAKMHENEHLVTTQIATIMGTLVQQKHQMAVLEAECNMLRNMVINLWKSDKSEPSNQVQSVNSNCDGLTKEETVHQVDEDMQIAKQNWGPVDAAMEQAAFLLSLMFYKVIN